jgi:hypothetical protein
MTRETPEENPDLLPLLQEAHHACGVTGEKTLRPLPELGAAAIPPYPPGVREPAQIRATEVLQNREKSQSAFEVLGMREVPPPPRVQEQNREVR